MFPPGTVKERNCSTFYPTVMTTYIAQSRIQAWDAFAQGKYDAGDYAREVI